MEAPKRFALLTTSLFILCLFNSCKEEAISTDVFAIEEPDTENLTSVNIEGMGELFVNSDRIQVADGIAEVKGTFFSEIDGAFIPVTSGDFTLSGISSDEAYEELIGYGIATVPEIGVFQEIVTDFTSGANFSLQRGSLIRSDDPLAPLQDDLNYFSITLDEALGEKLQFTVKSSSFTPEVLYMDPHDPMIYFRGDIGTPGLRVEDASIGLSARGNLKFTPFTYSDDLMQIMKVPLPSLDGNIFVGGLIPIPKYSIEVYGEALIGFTLNEYGFTEFFEGGFEGSSYRMGINGSVRLTDDFIAYLPETEVGRATVVVELEEAGNNYIQVAGESQIPDDFLVSLLQKLGGGILTSSFSMPSQTVEAYFYIGDDLDNSQFFIRTALTMIIPGIGPQELVEAMFGVDAEHIFLGANMGIPGLAEVYISGDVYYNGNFRLVGGTSLTVDVEVASVSVGFDVVVTQNGFEITAFGTGEIAGQSFTVEVDVRLNWQTGEMELCMDIPGIGNTCATFSESRQVPLNGRPYHPEPELQVIN